jgi:hypothetical protein
MALVKKPYRDCVKDALPADWRGEATNTHVAIEDARAQGAVFARMLRANRAAT